MKPVKFNDLGRLIRRLDMTQKQFCEKYDFCPTHLSNVKNGKAPLTKVMAARYGLAIHQEQQAQKIS
jgi:plasmid maintenance system antidote protein VapI